MIKNIIKYRKLIWDFVVRDYKSKFAGSMLGFVWNIIFPLVTIVMYALVFSKIMGAKLAIMGWQSEFGYSIYLCAGMIAWMSFAEVVGRSTCIYLENANLIKKMAFPQEILNAYVVVIGIINFIITFIIYVLFLLIVKYPITLYILYVIPLLLLQMLFAFSMGIALSSLTVFFRDIAQVVNVVLQLWFWGTPIVYLLSVLPKSLSKIMKLNPMYYFINAYHSVIIEQRVPEYSHILIMIGIVVATFIFGYFTFSKLKNEIPDEI